MIRHVHPLTPWAIPSQLSEAKIVAEFIEPCGVSGSYLHRLAVVCLLEMVGKSYCITSTGHVLHGRKEPDTTTSRHDISQQPPNSCCLGILQQKVPKNIAPIPMLRGFPYPYHCSYGPFKAPHPFLQPGHRRLASGVWRQASGMRHKNHLTSGTKGRGLHSANGPWKKKFELYFPYSICNPKSLKFGHWLSEASWVTSWTCSDLPKFHGKCCSKEVHVDVKQNPK